MIPEADVSEHARLGAAIMAALERWKTSDQKVAGLGAPPLPVKASVISRQQQYARLFRAEQVLLGNYIREYSAFSLAFVSVLIYY